MLGALHPFPASSLAISQACLQLYWASFHPSFLSCSGFLPSLCTCNSWPRTLFSTLADAVAYLLKVYSSFCHRTLDILGLREGGPKTWSRGGHITHFCVIICTRKSLWNHCKNFPYLLRGRYVRKNSHPYACLAFTEIDCETLTCCRPLEERKRILTRTQIS